MADLDHYDRGEPFVRRYEFRNSAGALADPDTVTGTAIPPAGGTERAYTVGGGITRISAGVFELVDTAVGAGDIGHWYTIVKGTGAVAATVRDEFVIDPRVPSDLLKTYALTTVEAAQGFLDRLGSQVSAAREEEDNASLAALINGFSLAAQNYMNRRMRPLETAVAKVFRYYGDGYLSLAPYEARTVTAITMATFNGGYSSTLTTSDYQLLPVQRTPESGAYMSLNLQPAHRRYLPIGNLAEETIGTEGANVTVTGNWGALEVPEDVRLAVHAAIAAAYRRQEEFQPRVLGDLALVDTPTQQVFNLPPDARGLLAPYVRPSPKLTTMTLTLR